MKHAIATLILLAALTVGAAETEERRTAFVETQIAAHVVALTPVGVRAAGPGRPATWKAQVWIKSEDGSLKTEEQGFAYVASLDQYSLLHPLRRNYVDPGPSEQQQVMAALAAVIGTFDDVNGWSPSTKSFVLGGKQIQLVSLTQNGQHVAYWGGAEVAGFGLITKRVDDLR